ncbi:MAG: cache domain-containing protein, partial [Gallionellaceae bacterium]|nr:cache domain-containing protein [Gallionellaceae bacterium]
MNPHFDRTRLVLLALLLALLGVGVWAYRGVTDSLREIRATGMQTLLNTQVGTLEQWIAERRREAEQLAADPELSGGIVRLAAGRSVDGARLIEGILRAAGPIGITAALLVDRKGKVLAASEVERIGRGVTPDFLAHLAPALGGRSTFVRPYRAGGMGRSWVAVPIRAADGRIVAVLALGSMMDEGFSDLFKAARPGTTGEALVFDAAGWLLSPSRHAGELQQRGLAPRLAQPDAEADRLTLLASQALAKRAEGGEGVVLQPYPNYLGRDAIGAWRWLHEYDIGVAIELEASEAYAPLTYLQIGFGVVLLLLFAVWLSGFLSPNALAGLLRRDGKARQLGPYR